MRLGCFPRCLVAVVALLPAAASIGSQGGASEQPPAMRKQTLRRPIALVLLDAGRLLLTANERSGSVSIIDTRAGRVVNEIAIGHKLADLVSLSNGSRLLAADEEANQLLVLKRDGRQWKAVAQVALPSAPVSIQAAADGRRCFVACLWSHRLVVVDLGADAASPKIVHQVSLPFAPRAQLLLPDGDSLIVADAFGGKMALVDGRSGVLRRAFELPGHNIRGLALADGRLLITHQSLNATAVTDFDDVHWGNLITNDLRFLILASLMDSRADILQGGTVTYLGDVGRGAGDPMGVTRTATGMLLVALAGAGEVAVGTVDQPWSRIRVGQRPTVVAASPDGNRAYVANTLSDTISVLDVGHRKVVQEIALGPSPELSAADRGEQLFYSARLTLEGWFSCQSCHTDGHTNGRLNDNLSDGSFGTPKRVLSLRGVRDTAPYAWLGTMPDLESQVRKSIQVTMQGPKPSDQEVHDLAAFLRTLPPAPPLMPPRESAHDPLVAAGRQVFAAQGCTSCHVPPTYTSQAAYDVGFADEAGARRFNPPSLRGVSQGGPYFHDSRATSLDEVFTRFHHQLRTDLKSDELKALLAFLQSL